MATLAHEAYIGGMPSRNTVKQYVADSCYHVYNRGVEKRNIFLDDEDYAVFLNLLKRYLAPHKESDQWGRLYLNYFNRVELLAFCLMPNHFHLLVWQDQAYDFSRLVQSVCTAYAGYFNKKYSRVGTLFQGVFKGKRIENDQYNLHISRYIHLNPLDIKRDYREYAYSSLPYYSGKSYADWVRPERVLCLFRGADDYRAFLEDPSDIKSNQEGIKHITDNI